MKKCKHGLAVCSECVRITDAARRMSDQINAHITFHGSWEIRNKWMRFKLQDGWTDGALYDTKLQAVRHCDNEKYYAFFCFRNALGGVTPKDCQIFLDVNRHQYDIGAPLADPDDVSGGKDNIVSTFGYDLWNQRPRELDQEMRRLMKEYGP
jgi:hypothetical protein